MKTRLLTLLLLASVYVSKGQTWEKQYPMPVMPMYYLQVMDYEFDTLNGGLIVGHNISLYNPQSFIVRINAAGDTLWTRFNDTSSLSHYYPDAVTTLSNGNYLIGGALHTSSRNYDIHEIDLNGNTISHTYIPLNADGSAGGTLEKGFFNDYYIKYQNDSMVGSSQWMSRHFIERRQNNGTLLWRKMYADTSTTGTVHIFDIVPTPDGGVVFSYEENYIAPGVIHLVKLDVAGNTVFDADPRLMMSALGTESYNVGPYIFPADDSTFITCFSISTYPGARQRSYVLRINNSTGAMMDSVSVYNKIRLDKGTVTSNNKLVFNYFKYINATSTVTEQGYITFDQGLNYNGMHSLPLSSGYVGPKLVANNVGGAFLSYNNTSYHYYAASFDSAYVTYPSEISGSVSVDNNLNCLTDAGDVLTGNSLVKLTDSAGSVFYGNAAHGNYIFHVPYGNYSVTHDVQWNKFAECPAGNTYSFSITSDTSITNANFYDTLVSGINDMEVMISQSCFVPGFNSNLDVYYFNAGTVTANTMLKVILDPSVTYLSSTPAPASISGDTLFYSVGPVYYDSIGMVRVSLNTPASLSLGSTLTFFAGVPNAGDVTPADNADTLQSIVTGAFDPNDKNVNQPYYIFGNEEMVYKVRFQNTGTLAAHNVIVKDTLDSDLDFSTFRLLGSSHPVNVVFEPGNGISFEFINIMLPDSTSNESGSHGEVVYSIQPRTGRPVGTSIKNKAFIYFDYNAAVITNTTTNVIAGATLGIDKLDAVGAVSLFPNPAQDEISILVPAKYRDYRIELLDIAGRVVIEKETGSAATVQRMDVSALNNGIYLLKVSDKQGSEVRKLIISK
ncbi:MAG: C-terminal target protein [Bacteroidetes bacterium]|nr:C-terminal target protein [Bacteroidota bacterium]